MTGIGITLIGLSFLLTNVGVLSVFANDIIWPSLLTLMGVMKLTGGMCKCCKGEGCGAGCAGCEGGDCCK